MNKLSLLLFLFLSAVTAKGQLDSNARSFASTITAFDLKEHLSFIASPGTQGRETGTQGLVNAANYIASQFGVYGVQQKGGEGTYFQSYKYVRNVNKDVTLFDSLQKFEYLKDFYIQNDSRNAVVYNKQIVFMGYGIAAKLFNDYAKDTNLSDKIIVILPDEPIRKKKYLATGTTNPSEWNRNISLKLAQLLKYKPAAVIVIDDLFYQRIGAMKKALTNDLSPTLVNSIYPINFPVLYTNANVAAKLLSTDSVTLLKMIKKTSRKRKPIHQFSKNKVSIEVDRVASTPSSDNVIGYVEGTDLKDEFVVISAHYDHLGTHKGKIYYGADDDGSGTAALLDISEAFAIAKRAGFAPRRSILFCAFSGEEKGLLGSAHYTKHPTVPLEKTVLNLNIDMIGRVDSTYTARQNANYIYPIGTNKLSSELKPFFEKCNNTYSKLTLDYKYEDPNDKNKFYSRSDHYNFAKNGVPVIFFFCGLHADYHKPTDTVDKIDFEKMQTITRLIFHVAWDAANQNNRLPVDLK